MLVEPKLINTDLLIDRILMVVVSWLMATGAWGHETSDLNAKFHQKLEAANLVPSNGNGFLHDAIIHVG